MSDSFVQLCVRSYEKNWVWRVIKANRTVWPKDGGTNHVISAATNFGQVVDSEGADPWYAWS